MTLGLRPPHGPLKSRKKGRRQEQNRNQHHQCDVRSKISARFKCCSLVAQTAGGDDAGVLPEAEKVADTEKAAIDVACRRAVEVIGMI